MSHRGVRVAAVLVLSVAACGGTPAGDSGAPDSGAIPGVTGLFASNGVAIPDPPRQDPCPAMGLSVMSCSPGDPCPALTCDCAGLPQKVEVPDSCFYSGQCLTAVSCPAICAAVDPATALFVCLLSGICDRDEDCTKPGRERCLRPPGQRSGGHCVSGTAGSDCYADADCGSSVCVATAGGNRVCQAKTSGSSCNRNDQCEPGFGAGEGTCILPDGKYDGLCTDRIESSPCHSGDHCLPGYACVRGPEYFGRCSSGNKGAPCLSDADCFQGFCVGPGGGTCDTGEPGASCLDASDCRGPACIRLKCAAGTNGSPCIEDEDCTTHRCAGVGVGGEPGQCTDGELGSACWGANSKQCEAGLHCTGGFPGTCAAAGAVGARCNQDSDCATQRCGGDPAGPDGLALCTEGKRGQRCRDTAQCEAGLRCVSNGFAGVCIVGAAGDPCLTAADCASGLCPSIAPPAPDACSDLPDLSRCAGQGACAAGTCFSICR